MLIKKNVLNEIGLYDERFFYAQDYKLMYDLIKSGYKLKILNKLLYELNTKDNISTKKYKEQTYYADCVKKGISP